MILELLCNLVLGLLEFIFGWVSFPALPASIDSAINTVLYYIEMGMGVVWLIVPRGLVLAGLPIILVVENFDRLYSITMWIIKKIPFLGMK